MLVLVGGAAALLASCRPQATGPITVSAIGSAPQLVNPNLRPLDPPAAFLTEAVAQGLVRFDASGEIEPALAQSWIVSDDGLRYTFRIRRLTWSDGQRVTAEQVAARLRAAISRASRNPFKPILAAISDVVAMTDEVLEIQLRGPRPNFLQVLAQPEMGLLLNGRGTGPYRVEGEGNAPLHLALPQPDDDDRPRDPVPDILLWGEPPAYAVTRFVAGEVELVTGGSIGDLAYARVADLPRGALVFDRPQGLFGLVFTSAEGPLAAVEVRRALSMAVDRAALARALDAGFEAHLGLVPGGTAELPRPAAPDWAAEPLPMRREQAAAAIAALGPDTSLRLRVAIPNGPGYEIMFSSLRRDWARIGVEAMRVAPGAAAHLRLVDAVAPANLPTWYLRFFTCDASPVCDAAVDETLQRARLAATAAERQAALAEADRSLAALTPYIALGGPVRWSLVSRRLTGFRPNAFARHPASELIAEGF
ncbi:ABC transporter substrate-binding protein [Sphingosinicella sp. LHD-64]|uniref:ABC transporter substrate-binding protein n=1 Tax=Sphingosinicella sp. LHD-64 TaxID=3072139 RepID=UPI00280F5E8A|nr:ABC transporter substrate-binding protein [Sphingosinicella sp. LHD-64]MDQ8757935.1 ABC transporter substrate-binding protein [Sphingosinicella sp. LHD-64]